MMMKIFLFSKYSRLGSILQLIIIYIIEMRIE